MISTSPIKKIVSIQRKPGKLSLNLLSGLTQDMASFSCSTISQNLSPTFVIMYLAMARSRTGSMRGIRGIHSSMSSASASEGSEKPAMDSICFWLNFNLQEKKPNQLTNSENETDSNSICDPFVLLIMAAMYTLSINYTRLTIDILFRLQFLLSFVIYYLVKNILN